MEMEIRRGDLFYINIPKDIEDPHKQTGIRPCIITSNDSNNKYCDRIHYIPLTTKLKKTELPVHVVLKSTRTAEPSMALCESLDSVDKSRVLEKVGHVSDEDMFWIEIALLKQQGIAPVMLFKNMKQYAQPAFA
jgi:mRNA interferase MazF